MSIEQAADDALDASIEQALLAAVTIQRAMRPYPVRVGWRTRAFHTRAERSDYELAFMCYPAPCEDTEAARLGWHDAAKTAGWRSERAAS